MAFQYDFSADFLTLDNLQPLTLRITGQADQPIPSAQDHPAETKDPDQAGGTGPRRRSLLGLADRRHPAPAAPGLAPDRQERQRLDHPLAHEETDPARRLDGPRTQPGRSPTA